MGDAGTILKTQDRGQSWEDISNDVISSLGTNLLRNGRRLNTVTLRSVKHFMTGDQVQILGGGGFSPARMVMIVGDFNTILRYDPCAITSEGVCFEQSFKWIDMSISFFEDFYGDLYDVFLFDPTVQQRVDAQTAPLAFAVGNFYGKDGNTYSFTRLNEEFGQMVVLRLTAHGKEQPQNSPHGWAQKTSTHTCFDAEYSYGCWTIVTPPFTEGNNYLTGFTQNSAELPDCCTSSTVRCYFPEDFISCYPWPPDLAVRIAVSIPAASSCPARLCQYFLPSHTAALRSPCGADVRQHQPYHVPEM